MYYPENFLSYLCSMAEDIQIISGTKAEQYQSLLPQIKGLLEGEPDLVANLANVVAALKEQFGWLWVGFYLVKPSSSEVLHGDKTELVLAPFQGPVACTRIRKGRGVCGTSWEKETTLIVPDVEKFPVMPMNCRNQTNIIRRFLLRCIITAEQNVMPFGDTFIMEINLNQKTGNWQQD